MHVPGLGEVTRYEAFDLYTSGPIAVPMLDGKVCGIILDGYEEDERKEDFHAAIANFLGGSPEILRAAEQDLFRYYKDFEKFWLDDDMPPIRSARDVSKHVSVGDQPMVKRRAYGDRGVYVSLECECDWEPEHGLQIVLKNGLRVNKLGPHDGHLTNSDAYDDERLENVIYRGRSQ